MTIKHHQRRHERNEATLEFAANHKDRWSDLGLDDLRNLAGTMTTDEVCMELGRSLHGTLSKAEHEGIPMPDLKTGIMTVTYRRVRHEVLVEFFSAEIMMGMLERETGKKQCAVKIGCGWIVAQAVFKKEV